MVRPATSLQLVCLVAASALCAAASAPAPAPGMLQSLVPTTAPGASRSCEWLTDLLQHGLTRKLARSGQACS